jgi:VCBS repeat-containing protein
VLVNDTGGAAALTAELVSPATAGTVTLQPDGRWAYTPESNYHGTVTFTYRATDGVTYGAETTVTLTILSLNDEPWAGPMNYTTTQGDGLFPTRFPAYDGDGDVLTFSINVAPEHGTPEVLPEGKFVYTPDPGFIGIDFFHFRAFDGQAYDYFDDGRVMITVNPAPGTPPVLITPQVDEGGGLVGYQGEPITGYFDDPPQPLPGGRVRYSVVMKPSSGKVKVYRSGAFRYKPRKRFTGTDTFVVRARTKLETTLQTIEVEVLPEGEQADDGGEPAPWALPAQDFLYYESPAAYYASEQYAFIASDGTSSRLLDHTGVIVVLHEGAAPDAPAGQALDADLVVLGTPSMDMIRVAATDDGRVEVFVSDRTLGTFNVTGAVRVYGLGGPDWLSGQGTMWGLELYGGGEYNFLQGSDGADLLYGGEHGDTLAGGAGNDVLVGGPSGSDELRGEAGEDLLVGGRTVYDPQAFPTDPRRTDADRTALLAAWTAASPLADRIAALTAPGALLAPGSLPVSTAAGFDIIAGGDDLDWFLAVRPVDQLTDRLPEEPSGA